MNPLDITIIQVAVIACPSIWIGFAISAIVFNRRLEKARLEEKEKSWRSARTFSRYRPQFPPNTYGL